MPLSELAMRSLERTWNAESDRALGELPGLLKRLEVTLNAKGLRRSGNHVREIDRLASATLSTVANCMFEKLAEANDSEAPNDVENRIGMLQGIFGDRVSRFHGALDALVHETNDRIGLLTQDRHRDQRTIQLAKSFDYERRSLIERIRFVVTASAKKETPMSNTVNISGGNVASIAVGENAQAIGQQHVAQGLDGAAVIAALGTVIAQVTASSVGSSKGREQVATLLDELRAEAAKPSPDKWRVLGIIRGAAEFVKFVPEAVAAWGIVSAWSSTLMGG